MITIHCTKKLLSRLPVGVGEQLRSEYSNYFAANDATPTRLSGWHGHLVTLQRRQCVLLVHDTTRFPVFIPALKKDDFAIFDHHFSDSFMNTLLKTGAEDELMEAAIAQLAPLMIETTVNRSVLGTLNQMVQHIQFAVEDGDVTISEITGYRIGAWLADTPWSAKGVKGAIWAADEMADLLLAGD
ncbi:hypothetical protein R0135_14205 [Congregibacter variabilis]|uniref:DUF6933 domain-containing protein n=1 Tax=Congregibacter variabilis TaxID=3081200 RepID=A0ABZ0I1A2_9GAMM|nr:hypothetical protein R0135_14205 [Congregibacter sp. IMCC43200]